MNLTNAVINSVREQNLMNEAFSISTTIGKTSIESIISEDPTELFKLILDAAVASDDFRRKVFQPDYPVEVGKIGYMSDQDLTYAIHGGLYAASMVADYIEKHCNVPRNANILDFGCGTLRICRYLIQFEKAFKYFACDVNPFSISWAQKEFQDRAEIFLMDNKPPLDLGEGSIDFAFAWSIFSHYSENVHKTWLEELHRILRPGGYLFVTFQSEFLLNRMKNEKDMIPKTRAENVDLEDLSMEYQDCGFGFYNCYHESEDDFGFDFENFGMAFISPDYIRREWTKLFEVVRIDPGMVANYQDVVLLRKPLPDSSSGSK